MKIKRRQQKFQFMEEQMLAIDPDLKSDETMHNIDMLKTV